jgi:hypothetical protein
MKMETVIRSPQDGVIKKLAHKEGVSILFKSHLAKSRGSDMYFRISAKLGQCWSHLRRKRPLRNHEIRNVIQY